MDHLSEDPSKIRKEMYNGIKKQNVNIITSIVAFALTSRQYFGRDNALKALRQVLPLDEDPYFVFSRRWRLQAQTDNYRLSPDEHEDISPEWHVLRTMAKILDPSCCGLTQSQ